MEHDWILDVLADLRNYASRNNLPALAEQLQETSLLAAVEISSVESAGKDGMTPHARRHGGHARPVAAGDIPRRAAS